MKMTRAHYTELSQIIFDYAESMPHPIGKYWDDYKNDGLSFERFRWNVLWASRAMSTVPSARGLGAKALGAYLYQYLNDSHIDTALRKIMSELIGG